MRRKTSITPIVVGIVIALLGILTGLYIAQHEHERSMASTAAAPEQPLPDAAPLDRPAANLPAAEEELAPVVEDESIAGDSIVDDELPEIPEADPVLVEQQEAEVQEGQPSQQQGTSSQQQVTSSQQQETADPATAAPAEAATATEPEETSPAAEAKAVVPADSL